MLITDKKELEKLTQKIKNIQEKHYGKDVFIRGLIEISNICKNDCLYCGIRRGNKDCDRYRLTEEEILSCCDEGYALGFRTFVMQGGEDAYFNDERLCDIVSAIKSSYPDCAVTLSMGERSRESYEKLYAAGADRYLLRHETATAEQAQEIHAYIREVLASKFGAAAAECPILYGGSCKPSNAAEIFAKEDVDGGLIGGAALKAEDFLAIGKGF